MKKLFTLTFFLGIFCMSAQAQGERFLDEVFDEVTVTDTVPYAFNTTVLPLLLNQPPAKRPLFFNLYEPADDDMEMRPLILLYHTGNFLPRIVNGQVSGSMTDPYIVDLATRLSKRGYVVAVCDYRKGWNPISDVREVRVNTLINAAYRGVQDSRVCARYFRATAAFQNNPHRIDPNKITVWGVGTGGYISQATGSLDAYPDVLLPKFFGSDVTGDGIDDPMVLLPVNGDVNAEQVGINPVTGDTLCFPSYTELGLSNEFQLSVNMGGALGDTSWLDANDPPMIGFHVPTDPSAPYDQGVLIVPTTQELVVEVQGSHLVGQVADDLGINDVFKNATFDDEITTIAKERSGGLSGMMPLPRPSWLNAEGNLEAVESGPWETWNAAFWSTVQPQACIDAGLPVDQCNWHLVSLRGNPDMSQEKSTAYLDTIFQYFAPRACVALDLPCASNFMVSTTEVNLDQNLMTIAPNPADAYFVVSTEGMDIESVEVYSMSGQLLKQVSGTNSDRLRVNRGDLGSGMYLVKTRVEDGVISQKLMLK